MGKPPDLVLGTGTANGRLESEHGGGEWRGERAPNCRRPHEGQHLSFSNFTSDIDSGFVKSTTYGKIKIKTLLNSETHHFSVSYIPKVSITINVYFFFIFRIITNSLCSLIYDMF